MRSVAVVPAAGSAERFGGKKLLTPIDGEPLLDRTIAAAADAAHKLARPMDNTSGTIAQRKKTVPVFATRALASLRVN